MVCWPTLWLIQTTTLWFAGQLYGCSRGDNSMVCRPTLWLFKGQKLYGLPANSMVDKWVTTLWLVANSMVVRRCRVYWSRLWRASVTAGVVCSRLYRRAQAAVTRDQRGRCIVQYNVYSRPLHSTNNDAVSTQQYTNILNKTIPQHWCSVFQPRFCGT